MTATELMSRSNPPRGLPAAAIGLVLAAVLAAPAQGADSKAAPAPKTALLTPAQLRDCMTQKEKVAKDTERVVKARAAVDAADAELASAGTALNEQAGTLDRTSEEAVTSYNAKVVERNARIDAHKARIAAYNADAEAVLAAKESYEKACANRRYDDRDLSDLQRKK